MRDGRGSQPRTTDVVYDFFFSSRRRHTRYWRDWSSDVCSSDLAAPSQYHAPAGGLYQRPRDVDAGGRCRGDAGDQGGARRVRLDGRDLVHEVDDRPDRKSVGEGKSVDFGGRRIIKKKKESRRMT